MEQTHAIATARTNEAKNELMSSDDAMPKAGEAGSQVQKNNELSRNLATGG